MTPASYDVIRSTLSNEKTSEPGAVGLNLRPAKLGESQLFMPMESVNPAQVAMLVQGSEVYGIGTIEKLYGEYWQDMTFVCLGTGALYDWLRARRSRVELVEGLVTFSEGNSLATLAQMPFVMRQAKRDARAFTSDSPGAASGSFMPNGGLSRSSRVFCGGVATGRFGRSITR